MATLNAALSASVTRPPESPGYEPLSRSLLRLSIPIYISGADTYGETFSQMTATELVSPRGATFECSRLLVPQQEVLVRSANGEILGLVVGQTGVTEHSHFYGVSFLQQDYLFWGVSFPREATEQSPLLQCSRCGQQLSSSINEIQALVLRANRQVLLPCPVCNRPEFWSPAEATTLHEEVHIERFYLDDQVVAATTSVECDPNLVPIASLQDADLFRPSPRAERRRHKRVSLPKAKACIELPGTERDIIDIIDVSRGGACVRSANSYPIGSWIRIACPYTIGGSNIFQSARIVRVTVGDSIREYGIEYVRLV